MKQKVLKGFAKKLTAAAMLSMVVFLGMPVFAETNHSWSGYANTPGSSIRTSTETKYTDSSVIANYSSGSSDYMMVTVLVKDSSGSWKDCTYYTGTNRVYIAHRGTSEYVSVMNLAYETYGKSKVAANFTAISAGSHRGVWRPDN